MDEDGEPDRVLTGFNSGFDLLNFSNEFRRFNNDLFMEKLGVGMGDGLLQWMVNRRWG